MYPMMYWGYGSMGVFGWIFMIFWWLLIVFAFVVFVRWIARSGQGGAGGKSALDILKERYASGEINKKEFEEKSKDIRNL